MLDVGLTLGVNLGGTLLLFLLQVLLARVLGEVGYSQFSYTFAILTVLTTLSLFGFDVGIQRFVPTAIEEDNAGELRGYLLRAMQAMLVMATALGAMLVASALALSGHISEELQTLLVLAAFAIPGGSLLLLASACARALRKPLLAAAPRLAVKPLLVIAGIAALALAQPQLTPSQAMMVEIAASLALAGFVALAVALHLNPTLRASPASFRTGAWLAVSFPLFLNAGFQIMIRQTDVLILGGFIGADEVGSYVVATKIAALASFGLLAINAVVPPIVVRHVVRDEHDQAQRVLGIAALALFAFSLGTGLVLWVLGEMILGWFGESFVVAKPLLNLLIMGQLLNAGTGSVSFILGVTGHQNVLAKVVAGALLLNIALCFALIPAFGAMGAAVAVTLATSASNLVLLVLCKSRTGLDPSILSAMRSVTLK
ncbi:MAG: oligosaccharide flippase family protein [Erythrobacter sp.]|uniref:oligosaccharide flippase family protein n=1 Tax=Erythrobacter sp. TaxID=1042 RepID=UPI003A87399E